MKRYKIGWILVLLLGVISLMSPSVLADKKNHPVTSGEVLHCKTTLKRFCLRLEACSKQPTNQAYYENLYQQTQDFLSTLEAFPPNSSQIDKCENFLKVIQDIIGSRGVATDLAPMPNCSTSHRGKLTKPVLETAPKRPLGKPIQSIRYEYDNPASKRTIETAEEAEEAVGDELKLISSSAPRLSRTRNFHASEETKEIE